MTRRWWRLLMRWVKCALLSVATCVCRVLFGGESVTAVEEHITLSLGDGDCGSSSSGTTFRLAFLTDFHYCGSHASWLLRCISPSLLDDAIAKVAAFRPDAVLLGGDFVDADGAHAADLCMRWLSQLPAIAPDGVYAVTGNHDSKGGPGSRAQVVAALRNAGVRLLDNESVVLRNGLIELVGVGDWLTAGEFRPDIAFANVSTKGCRRVLLQHNPDATEQLLDYPQCDLQLSGHTHGGQVVLRRTGPVIPWLQQHAPSWMVPHARSVRNWQWAQGLHEVGHDKCKRLLYVSRGLGTHPPLRWQCPPEVTLITLQL